MAQRYMIILLAILVLAGMAWSQTKTTFTIGGTWWSGKYDWIANDSDLEDVEIGTGNFVGPYVSINHGKVNFGASALFGTMEVDDWEGVEIKRSDLNFTLGYRIVSSRSLSMNLFGGFKSVKFTTTGSYMALDFDEYYGEFEDEWTIDQTVSGPMYGGGLSMVIPFGDSNLYGYGSVAYLTGTLTLEDNDTDQSVEFDEPTNLVSITGGLGYRFSGGFGISGGYRGDFFSNDEADYVERLSGLSLTASLTF